MFLLNLSLIDVRIVFLLTAFVHLIVTAIVTLSIDTTVDDDPEVRAYHYIRWKLITCWFNLIMLAYLPMRLFVDWQARRGVRSAGVKRLQHASDVVMTAILFPVVMYADSSFWLLYNVEPAAIGPPRVFEYLPSWAQHSLHSVSCAVVVVDLLLTPRRRPASLMPRLALLLAFSTTYFVVIAVDYFRGVMVYKIFAVINVYQIFTSFAISLLLLLSFFSIQWVAIDYVWQSNSYQKSIHENTDNYVPCSLFTYFLHF